MTFEEASAWCAENRARWGFGPSEATDRTVLWVELGAHRVELESDGPPAVDQLLVTAVSQLVARLARGDDPASP